MNLLNKCTLAMIAALPAVTSAQDRPLVFNQTDGTVRQVSTADVTEVLFNEDASVASFYLKGTGIADYSLKLIESLTFSDAESAASFSAMTDFSVSMDSADASSAKNLTETVASDESQDDYDDFVENYETTKTVTITYSGSSATYTGKVSGIEITTDGAHVTVKSAIGKVCYELKGSTTNGSFKIVSDKKFRLKLNGVTIINPEGSAINIQSGKAAYIMLASGTQNRLADGKEYTYTDGEDMKGTVFSEGQLLFSGSGSLSIKSYSAHGICSDDYIRFRSGCGNITIDAGKDGISSKDHFTMYGGNVTVLAGDDGIDVRRGYLSVCGGTLDVTASDNGLSALYSQNDTTFMDIKGGFIKIQTTGSKGHAIYSTGNLSVSGGTVQASVGGDASKTVNVYGKTVVSDSKLTLMTSGDPLYDDDENDFSSAAGMRCRSDVYVTDSEIGIYSTGKGGKGINGDAGLSIENSAVTILTEGDALDNGSEKVKSRGIDVETLTVTDGTCLCVSATHNAVKATEAVINGGESVLFSSSAKSMNIQNTSQTGGLILRGN